MILMKLKKWWRAICYNKAAWDYVEWRVDEMKKCLLNPLVETKQRTEYILWELNNLSTFLFIRNPYWSKEQVALIKEFNKKYKEKEND